MIHLLLFELASESWPAAGQWDDNRLRGALGKSLRAVSCATRSRTCTDCPIRGQCAYGVCYEPVAQQDGRFTEAGQEAPRPYVLRRCRRPSGHPGVSFELVLLGRAAQLVPYFVVAAVEWERPGMGFGDAPVKLRSVHAVHPFTEEMRPLYLAGEGFVGAVPWTVTDHHLECAAQALPADALAVEFLTPTRLKFQGNPVRHSPPFRVLVSALLRRVEGLRQCHDLNFEVGAARELILASDAVKMESWEGHQEQRQRYSYRQHQRMCWEGFVGRAVYQGDLAPYRRLLRLGELIHVGKGAVFGLGRFRVRGVRRE